MRKDSVLYKKYTFNMFLALAGALVFLLSFTPVNAAAYYPTPTDLKYVNDYTSTLDNSTKEYIVSVGKELEDKTGAQAVVVVIDSLQESDIATYSNTLFRTWGIGQKGKNNGLLVLMSMKDRKWRVEVGTSLEGAIPDIYSARVMDSVATPKFKEGNYSGGIKDSYSIFADAIAKEYNVTLDKNEKVNLPAENNATGNRTIVMVTIILLLVFVILDFIFNRGQITLFMMSMAFLSGRGRGGGRGGWGGGNNDGGGGFGGMGGGSSSGGGSSGGW
jgi:uncharacterized protein